MTLRTLYAVRNQSGKWLRGGGRETWVDDLADAKLWDRLATARARVTYWATHYPSYGIPDLVALTVTAAEVLEETERVEKRKAAIDARNALQEKRNRAWRIQYEQQNRDRAIERLAELDREQTGGTR